MFDFLGPGGMIAVMVLAALLAFIVLLRYPEALIAVLLTGQGFISVFFKLLGMEVNRATFAIAGSILFLAIVLLFLLGRLMRHGRAAEKQPFFGQRSFSFILVVVALAAVLGIGLIYTEAVHYGGRKMREFFTFGFAPFFLCFLFVRDLASVKRLMWLTLLMAGFFVALTMAYSFSTTGALFSGERIPDRTFWGPFEIPGNIELGSRLAICFQSLLVLAFMARRRFWLALAFPLMLVILGNVLSQGARTGLVVLVVLAFLTPKLIFRGKWGASLVSALVLVLAMTAYFLLTPEHAKSRFLQPLTDPTTSGGLAFTERQMTFQKAVEMISKKPALGWGTGGFAMYAAGIDDEYFPHNMFLEIWSENGIPGLALLISLWYMIAHICYSTYKRMPANSFGFFAVVWVVGLLANEFVMGQFHYGIAHAASCFLLACGLSLKVCALAEHSLNTSTARTLPATPSLPSPVPAAGRP